MDLDMKHPLKKNNLPAHPSGKTYYRYAALVETKACFALLVNERA